MRPAVEPAVEPTPEPSVGAGPTTDTGDAGVLSRMRRRTAGAGVIPLVCAIVLAGSGWFWPAWFSGSAGTLLGGLVVVLLLSATAVLLRRASLWRQAEAESETWVSAWAGADRAVPDWVKAVCGEPTPLFAGRGAIPMLRRERRFPSRVLPVRTASGPLAAGFAVVVHARTDGAFPAPSDRIRVLALQPRGPILIGRLDDGAVFAADRWTVGAG
jgi:hypothetical protein